MPMRRPGRAGVRGHPMKIPEPGRMVGGWMLTEAPQPRTAGLTKPTLTRAKSLRRPREGDVGQRQI